jgi:hypothetical protein
LEGRVSGFGFRVWKAGYRVSGIGFRKGKGGKKTQKKPANGGQVPAATKTEQQSSKTIISKYGIIPAY